MFKEGLDITTHETFFFSFRRILSLKVYLNELQYHIQYDPLDNFLLAEERVLNQKIKNLMRSEESILRQKARAY